MTWVKYPDKVPNKYYDHKWKEGAYGVPSGYKYGQFKPWMVKDNGKPLKKNGRKKWTTLKSKVEVARDVWQVVNLMTFWAKKVTWVNNIKDKVSKETPMTIHQACDELWIKVESFYYYLNRNPDVKEQYQVLKENRREYMRETSEYNIQKALTWKMKSIKESEIVDYSFKMLERTDKNYNPKQVVETTVEEINPNRTTDDIIWDIADLIK